MKHVFLISVLLFSHEMFAQEHDINMFSETFDNMFTSQIPHEIVDIPQDQGNPGVPLDGGLTALLLAGGAVGYRKYRARSKK